MHNYQVCGFRYLKWVFCFQSPDLSGYPARLWHHYVRGYLWASLLRTHLSSENGITLRKIASFMSQIVWMSYLSSCPLKLSQSTSFSQELSEGKITRINISLGSNKALRALFLPPRSWDPLVQLSQLESSDSPCFQDFTSSIFSG